LNRSPVRTGSYSDRILLVSSALFLIGAIPLLLLGKYRDYDEPIEEQSEAVPEPVPD
jgi:hypothetical protein